LSTPHQAQPVSPSGGEPDGDLGDTSDRARRFVLAMRLLAALSALMSLAALWSVEARQQAHDLQLAAAPSARPGDRIALRALIFRDVDAPEGPTLASAQVRVRLLDGQGRQLAEVPLVATPLTTHDGGLRLPAALAGDFTLEARASFEGESLLCRRALHIDARAPTDKPRGREAGPLQHLALGRVRTLTSAPPPDVLLARVVGGACVPGTTCRVLVWVGSPAAALSAHPGGSVSLRGPPLPGGETSGLVELSLVVEGLDAELTLEARRAGVLVAERALRLPMGLGEVALPGRGSIVEPGQLHFAFVAPPGREQLTFDVFTGGRWAGLSTHASAGGQPFEVPADWAHAGLLRVQARADRLSAEGSGARVVYVRAAGEDDGHALTTIARLVAEDPGLEPSPTGSWARELPAFAAAEPQQSAAFLLASLEELRMPVPLAASGRPAQLQRLAHTRALFRFGVAGALALSAFVIGLSIARRGLLATDQAQAILELARSDPAEQGEQGGVDSGHELFSARLRVLLLALAVASAFLAGALLIAAKPLWF